MKQSYLPSMTVCVTVSLKGLSDQVRETFVLKFNLKKVSLTLASVVARTNATRYLHRSHLGEGIELKN